MVVLINSAYLKVRSSFFFHVIDMPMACVMIEKEIKAGSDIFSCGLIHFINVYSSILKLVKCFSPGSPTCIWFRTLTDSKVCGDRSIFKIIWTISHFIKRALQADYYEW